MLEQLPPLSSLKGLRKLGAAHNQLRELPQGLTQLYELRLNHNKISKVPSNRVPAGLKVLDLGSNLIKDFRLLISKLIFSDIEGIKEVCSTFLNNLNLKGNEICQNNDYQKTVFNLVMLMN